MDKTKHQNFRISIASVMLAMLVLSCDKVTPPAAIADPETTPTQISYNHRIVESQDGVRKYRFETPLLEKYDEAKEPYIEFRQGIKIETFSADSLTIESDLTADYAHFNEAKQIWEARGNVIAHNLKEDKTLYTEQLFWDQAQKKIYTAKPARVIDRGSTHRGIGFEADEKFEVWQFNRARGQIEVEEQTTADSTSKEISDTTVVK